MFLQRNSKYNNSNKKTQKTATIKRKQKQQQAKEVNI